MRLNVLIYFYDVCGAKNLLKMLLNLHHFVSPDDFDGVDVILERL